MTPSTKPGKIRPEKPRPEKPRPEISIGHNEKNKRGRYWMDTTAGEAELVYSLGADDRMVINSTYVPIEARGGGVALALVKKAVSDAQERGRKVDPVCPYVDRIFARHPEWRGVRAP